MTTVFRLALAALLWLPAYALLTILWLLGWPATIIGILRGEIRSVPSRHDGRLVDIWAWPILWLWCGDEDGVFGPTE